MASPFTTFRKNQKVMMAVMTILIMFGFVFLQPLIQGMGRSRGSENPVVVKTRYGDITQSDLDSMRVTRELAKLYLRTVTRATVNEYIKRGMINPNAAGMVQNQAFTAWFQDLMMRSKPGQDEAAIETFILAKKAQQAGMVVSDRAINEMLKQRSSNILTGEELQKAIKEISRYLTSRGRVSTARVFEGLRTEMLASRYAQLFLQSLGDIPPAQRFDCFLRLNQKAKCEVMPLPVASFTDQVPNPSETDLTSFYEKYKDQFPDPASPEPGFKEPKLASFQYFKADFAKFKDQAATQVTEDEIKKYYEDNKAQFRVVNLPAEEGAEPKGDAETPANGDKPADAPNGDKPDDATKPSDDKSAPGDQPGGDKPTDDKPAGDAKPESSEPSKLQSSGARRAEFRLVSMAAVDDQPNAAPAETPAAEPATGDAKPTETPAPVGAEGDGDNKPAADDKPAEGAPPSNDQPAEGEAKPEEPKYEPLEKVQDQIRDILASQKAREEINKIFDDLAGSMKRYEDDMSIYNAQGDRSVGRGAPTVRRGRAGQEQRHRGQGADARHGGRSGQVRHRRDAKRHPRSADGLSWRAIRRVRVFRPLADLPPHAAESRSRPGRQRLPVLEDRRGSGLRAEARSDSRHGRSSLETREGARRGDEASRRICVAGP